MGCMHAWGGTCPNCVTSVRLNRPKAPALVSPKLEDAAPALADQMSELVGYFNIALKELQSILNDDTQIASIMGEAASRSVTGFVEYGDTMWTWTSDRLLDELRQELADAIVYTARLMSMKASEDAQG